MSQLSRGLVLYGASDLSNPGLPSGGNQGAEFQSLCAWTALTLEYRVAQFTTGGKIKF